MFEPTGLGRTIFQERYTNYPTENWDQASFRVAEHVARAEQNGNFRRWADRFYSEIVENRFMPGGRIWYGSGRSKAQLLNCFVLPTADSREGWGKTVSDVIVVSGTGGGIGINCSPIRPRGAEIKGTGGRATGPVSLMQLINKVGDVIVGGGTRRTALMLCLDINHPDIQEFLDSKLRLDQLTLANISVVLNQSTQEFQKSVREGGKFDLFFAGRPTGEQVQADIFWQNLVENAWKNGEPGVLNGFEANRQSNIFYYKPLISTNPSLAAGTLIATSDGIFPIEQLEGRKFRIKAIDGQWADAKCWLSGRNKEVLEVSFGNHKTIRATREHRWPVFGRSGRLQKVFTSELGPGDLIPLNRNEPTGIQGDLSLTRQDGFLAGYMFGDGWLSQRCSGEYTGGLTFSKQETGLAEMLLKEVNDRKASPSNLSEREHELTFSWGDRRFCESLLKIGVSICKDNLPGVIWTSNDEYIKGFVDGLLSADGHVALQGKYICLTTSRVGVAMDFAKLLSFYGVSCSIQYAQTKSFGKVFDRWDVRIGRNQCKRFARIFQITHTEKAQKLEIINGCDYGSRREEEYAVVKSVKVVAFEDVWDIAVDHPQHVFPSQWCYTGNCGEIWLEEYGCCCLGALVLPRFVKNGQMDWDQLDFTIRTAVRFLDNVLTVNVYPLPEIKENSENVRRIGMGVMGLHSMLLELGYRYSSPEGKAFVSELFDFIKQVAYDTSIHLAVEKGPFPAFDQRFLDSGFSKTLKRGMRAKIREYGIRNCALLTIAPTGTTSIVAGVSSGVEPLFAPVYWRNYRKIDEQARESPARELVATPEFQKFGELAEGAYDIPVRDHFEIQAIVQKHIDNAVSKTINLPKDFPQDELAETWLDFLPEIKGSTFYREGSRGNEPLEYIPVAQARRVLEENSFVLEFNPEEQGILDCPNGVCEIPRSGLSAEESQADREMAGVGSAG